MSGGYGKRVAAVPREADRLDVSKADLLEAAWELAALCNDGEGADDMPATYCKLVETLNAARGRSRRGQVKAFAPVAGEARLTRVDALTVKLGGAS